MDANQQKGNPYIGPRPFQRSERDRFFGREREARALISLVVSERLVLFYAQSGAGKSSLINARLVPGLEERGFAVMPVARVSGQSGIGETASNLFIYNLLLSLEPGDQERTDLAQQDLKAYLAALPVEESRPGEEVEELADGGYQPLALIIDQFEELFTSHPEAWEQRRPFFEQISAALQADPNLWIVLSMREDYIAALDPYARFVPNRLRARFYMERMDCQAALEAVTKPVEKLRPFDLDAAQQLVNNLLLLSAGVGEDGQPVFSAGEYIEPVQLQVVCFQLWEQLKNQPGQRITSEDLALLARGGDLAQFVSRALADFYEQAISRVLRHPGARTTERELRDWFSRELITEASTRGFVFIGEEKTGSLPNSAVRLLENEFIVRSETRAAGKWVELVHDRFVGPILQANQEWLVTHVSPIAVDAAEWLRSERDPQRLYDGRQLKVALEELDSNQGEFGEKERAFLKASREASERRHAVRQRRRTVLASFVLFMFAFLAAFGLFSARTALRKAEEANIASTQAAYAVETSQALSVQAVVQQSYAEDAQVQAEFQSTLASQAQASAEFEGRVSRSSQAAALSAYYLETDLEVARILSVESFYAYDGWEARKAMLDGLQRGSEVRVNREFGPLTNGLDIWAVDISPDGRLVAAGDALGEITLWDANQGVRSSEQPPDAFRQAQQIYAVAFDAAGNFLAAGGKDGVVGIWDRSTGRVQEIPVVYNDWVTNVAFQPGGSIVAVARRDGMVSLVDYRGGASRGVLTISNIGAWGLAWSPDGSRLAVGYSDGSIRIWDLVSQLNPMELRGHDETLRGLAFSPDGRFLYSGGRDQRLILWDVAGGQPVRQSIPEETGDIMALDLSSDGRLLITGNADQVSPITVWDVETLRPAGTLSGHENWVMAVAISDNGGRFTSGGVDESVFTWKVVTQQPLSRVIGETDGAPFAGLALDSSNRWVALTAGNEMSLNSEAAGSLPLRLPGGDQKAVILPGKELSTVSGAKDGSLIIRDVLTGQILPINIAPLGGSILALAASQDGSLLAAASCQEVSEDGVCTASEVHVVDLESGSLTGDEWTTVGQVQSLAFTPDQSAVAVGLDDGTITIYLMDEKEASTVPALKSTSGSVTSLAFNADGSLLAAGLVSGDISLWDTNGYRLIGRLSSPDRSPVNGLVFRETGDSRLTLLASSESGTLREWDTDVASWAARSCQLAGRSLTPEEWDHFFKDEAYRETCRLFLEP